MNNPEYSNITSTKFIRNSALNYTYFIPSGYGGGFYYTCDIGLKCNVLMNG
jgi:hypothetical protein